MWKWNQLLLFSIGLPPFCHGSFSNDIELQLLKNGIHVFVEKPVSVIAPEKFRLYVDAVERLASNNRCVVSVGYMFRYHPAIHRIKEELVKYGRPIVAVNGRYSCAYSELSKPFWWHIDHSGGPIVEQATHFCDVIRFIAGEVDLDSIQGLVVPISDDINSPGHLAELPGVVKSAGIPRDKEIPCATQATWRFVNGGIGCLSHTVTLHGFSYESFLDIYCDGLILSLSDPYSSKCVLRVRTNKKEKEFTVEYPEADPYYNEDKEFFAAIKTNDPSCIRSTYIDAAKTYELTWAIRRATAGR